MLALRHCDALGKGTWVGGYEEPWGGTSPGSVEFAQTLHESPHIVFVMNPVRDESGTIIELVYGFLNDAALRLYGMASEDVLGHGLLELFPSTRDIGIFDATVRTIETQQPVDIEVPWIDEKGVRGAFRQQSVPHGDGALLTVFDVTASMLGKSELRYRLLAEGMSDVVYTHGLDGVVDWVSPSVTEVLGWSREDFTNASLRDLIHPDDAGAMAPVQAAILDSGADTGRVEMRFATVDGRWRWMSVATRITRDDEGRVIGAIEALRDIQSEVETREALAAQAERLELVLEGAGLGMWDRNVSTGTGVWDERCAGILGYSLADLQPAIAEKWIELTHPDDLAPALQLTEDHVAGRRPRVDFLARMRHRDGRWVWVRIRGRIVEWSSDGQPLRMTGTMEDTTEQIQSRQSLERSEETLRATQRLARLGSLTWDRATDRVTWSDELFELFGLEVGGSPPDFAEQEKLYGAKSWEKLRAAVAEATSSGTPYELELEFVRADSSRGWLRVRGEAVLDDDGVVVGVQGYTQDITEQQTALNELERRDQTLSATQRMAHLGSWTWDLATDHTVWSDELFELFGVNPALGAPDFAQQVELFGAESWSQLEAAVAETSTNGVPYDLELEYVRKDGDRGWFRVRGEAVRDAAGVIVGLLGYVLDITEYKQVERALAASELLFRTAMLSSPLGMAMADLDGSFRVVNESLCRLVGRDAAWLVTHTEQDLRHPDEVQGVSHKEGEGAARGPEVEAEAGMKVVRLIHADGRVLWVKRAAELIAGEAGRPDYLLIQYADNTAEHEALDQLEYQAFHDPLTGLRNRAWILDMLDVDMRAAPRSGGQVGVLFIDLDHFKIVNDSLGHAAGDDVLMTVADRIAGVLRPKDRVGRSGGDEFIVVLPNVKSAREAEVVADRIVSSVATALTTSGHRIVPTVSIGIALNAPDSTSASLLRDADAALFRAKAAGRSRWQFFDGDMHAQALSRLTIEEETRQGLDRAEFVVHYQPIVTLADGRVAGHEALVRWQHPLRGVLSPASFLATAEDSGLIVQIGQQVLDQVCALLASSPDLPGPVSLNLSPVQLAHSGWLRTFTDTLARHGVEPSRVIVELTETAALALLAGTREDLMALRDLGVGIHVDDFGTGFSSISLLRDLPITGLKLDKAFVADLVEDDDAAHALSAGLAGLAEGLHLQGIAEGVESQAQHLALLRHGWSHAQGYLYGRPAPQPVLKISKPPE